MAGAGVARKACTRNFCRVGRKRNAAVWYSWHNVAVLVTEHTEALLHYVTPEQQKARRTAARTAARTRSCACHNRTRHNPAKNTPESDGPSTSRACHVLLSCDFRMSLWLARSMQVAPHMSSIHHLLSTAYICCCLLLKASCTLPTHWRAYGCTTHTQLPRVPLSYQKHETQPLQRSCTLGQWAPGKCAALNLLARTSF